MAVMLPGWLERALNYLDLNWPTSNEDVLNQWASDLRGLSSVTGSSSSELTNAVNHVHGHNEGPGVEAFVASMRSQQSNINSLEEFKTACDVAAGACDTCATIVRGMKLAVIFQLGLMAASLASGPGAFLVKQGIKMAINWAIDQVAERVLNG